MPRSIRVLILCDQPIVAAGLSALFDRNPGIGNVEIADQPGSAEAALRGNRADVAVLDPQLLPDAAALLVRQTLPARVLLLHAQPITGVREALQAATVCGVLPRRASAVQLQESVAAVSACRRSHADDSCCPDCPARRASRLPTLPLTPRQQQVFVRIGEGWGTRRIAGELAVSVKTVESYREDIKRLLGLADSTALVRAAVLWQLGELSPAPVAAAQPRAARTRSRSASA